MSIPTLIPRLVVIDLKKRIAANSAKNLLRSRLSKHIC